jgi:hypothetical protein
MRITMRGIRLHAPRSKTRSNQIGARDEIQCREISVERYSGRQMKPAPVKHPKHSKAFHPHRVILPSCQPSQLYPSIQTSGLGTTEK